MEALCRETDSFSAHEASAGVCQPEEWRKPGQNRHRVFSR